MQIELKTFDVIDFLKTDEDIQAYLNAAIEEGKAKFLFTALGDVVRAKNLNFLSK